MDSWKKSYLAPILFRKGVTVGRKLAGDVIRQVGKVVPTQCRCQFILVLGDCTQGVRYSGFCSTELTRNCRRREGPLQISRFKKDQVAALVDQLEDAQQ